MRRVKPDPIPVEVQQRILDAAVRAPSGGNSQNWRFLFVDDPELRGKLGPLYRASLDELWAGFYADRVAAAEADPDSEESKQMMRIRKSADHLADHFAEVPLLLFGFAQHDTGGSSIFPAIWSAMLAARAARHPPPATRYQRLVLMLCTWACSPFLIGVTLTLASAILPVERN